MSLTKSQERGLAEALAKGQAWNAQGAVLPARLIAAILTGTGAAPLEGRRPFRMIGGRVAGHLDLSNLPRDGDGHLPVLDLTDVALETLSLDNSRFSRVALRGCRLSHLSCCDADFTSGVDLSGLSAPAGSSNCWIDMTNCRVDGDVRLANAKLTLPQEARASSELGPHLYALILRGADVTGAVRLEPGFSADGGITVADAHIGGDLRAHGAQLQAHEGRAALRAQNVRIDGTLFCKAAPAEADMPERRFQAVARGGGGLVFQNAHIGKVEMDGCRVRQAGGQSEWTPAIDLSHATIAGSVSIRRFRAHPSWAPELSGAVILSGARIGGDADITAARIWLAPAGLGKVDRDPRLLHEKIDYALDMRGSELVGTLRICDGFRAVGGVTVADARIGGDIMSWGAQLSAPRGHGDALRGRNLTLSGVLRAGGGRLAPKGFTPMKVRGGIAFPNATMDYVDLSCAQIGRTDNGRPARVDFENAHIRGGLFLCSGIEAQDAPAGGNSRQALALCHAPFLKGSIFLKDAVIEGDVDLFGLEIEPDGDLALSATGVRITGSLNFGDRSRTRMTEKGSPASIIHKAGPPVADESVPAARMKEFPWRPPDIGLTGAEIGGRLFLGAQGMRSVEAAQMTVKGRFTVQGRLRSSRGGAPPAVPDAELELSLDDAHVGGLRLQDVDLLRAWARGVAVSGRAEIRSCEIIGDCQFDRLTVGGPLSLLKSRFDMRYPAPAVEDAGKSHRPFVPSLYLDGSSIGSRFVIREVESSDQRSDKDRAAAHVSLIHAKAGVLDDRAGREWGLPPKGYDENPELGLHLRLNGFTYGSFHHPLIPPSPQGGSPDKQLRVVMAILGGTPFALLAITLAAVWWNSLERLLNPFPQQSFYTALLIVMVLLALGVVRARHSREKYQGRVWSRLRWLELQHGDPDTVDALKYHPQPFIQAARTYRNQGLFEYSDSVLKQRIEHEVAVKRKRLDGISEQQPVKLGRVARFIIRTVWSASAWVYRIGFGYGLSPMTALSTLIFCVTVGAAVAGLGMSAEIIQATPSEPGASVEACMVSPTAYSLGHFIPFLDLGTDDECRLSGPLWTNFLAVFSLIGGIVTSLVALTFTGVLRRMAES